MHTESDITGQIARQLREELGLSQREFWVPLGVLQSVGCRYETADIPVPASVRILLVTRYCGGLMIDAATPEGVAELARLGSIQQSQQQAKTLSRVIAADLEKAIDNLAQAKASILSITT